MPKKLELLQGLLPNLLSHLVLTHRAKELCSKIGSIEEIKRQPDM